MSSPSTLCIFSKPPIPGVVNARIAAAIGLQHSAALETALLLDTISLSQRVAAEAKRPVSTAMLVADMHPLFRTLAPELPRWPQGDGDLGARLERAIRYSLTLRPRVAIIGSDAPHMPS